MDRLLVYRRAKFINLSIKQRSVLKFEDKLTGIVAGQNIRIKLLAKKPQNTPHKSAHCGSLLLIRCFVGILAVVIYNYNSY